jgi:hypothetical protein
MNKKGEIMSVRTTADEHLERAQEYIEKARKEIGLVLIDNEMWGSKDYKLGYLQNCFFRTEGLLRAIKGDDLEGNTKINQIISELK